MPRISAPTVAEHRAHQERAVVDAAIELLVESGQGAVTPAAVAKRTGLARTSVYLYHPSAAGLLAAAVEAMLTEAVHELDARLAGSGADPLARLDAYIATMLTLAEAGHSPSRPISLADAPAEQRARIRALHEDLAGRLGAIVQALGVPDARWAAALASGTIQGAVQLVEHGADPAEAQARTTDFLRRALRT